jgi:hypothetical protein
MAWITTPEAARRASRSTQTLRRWASRYSIGRKVGGRFEIDASGLELILAGRCDELARR